MHGPMIYTHRTRETTYLNLAGLNFCLLVATIAFGCLQNFTKMRLEYVRLLRQYLYLNPLCHTD